MHKPSALLAAIAFFVALSFVASCGQPEPWEPTADREARAIDRLLWLLEPSEAHAQLFPSTLTDTLRLGKGRYKADTGRIRAKPAGREILSRPHLDAA